MRGCLGGRERARVGRICERIFLCLCFCLGFVDGWLIWGVVGRGRESGETAAADAGIEDYFMLDMMKYIKADIEVSTAAASSPSGNLVTPVVAVPK